MNNSKLTPKVQKNLMLTVAILWIFCTVIWGVAIAIDILHDAAILQVALHIFCGVLAALCAVLNFRRWRRMPDAEELTGEKTEEPTADTLDSTDN